MLTSDWIASFALFASVASLALSFANYKRDSANLRVRVLLSTELAAEPYITVSFTNTGRRPAFIHGVGGSTSGGLFVLQSFSNEGLEIPESGRREFNYSVDELQSFDEGERFEFDRLVFTDGNHKRQVIKGSKRAIKRLRSIA